MKNPLNASAMKPAAQIQWQIRTQRLCPRDGERDICRFSSIRTPPLHLIFRLKLPRLAVVGSLIPPNERIGAYIVERPSRLFATEIGGFDHVAIVAHGSAGKFRD